MDNWMKAFVRGFTWKARMSNGAVFTYWTPSRCTRAQAREELLKIAEYYTKDEIENLWMVKG